MFKNIFSENKAQASAEFILLFGGIIIIVLFALFFYKRYLTDFASEINSTEINNFDDKINNIIQFLNE
ncbi:class III signal peptide-containing protein [Methanobrevibacter sp. OttesenSCG-928-K11]|nr:class III signal peptide-containing protein [Methanobrevibacter sp. OttesenSCG-928-K11]